MRRVVLAMSVVALALPAVGCGGGDEKSGSTSAKSGSSTATTDGSGSSSDVSAVRRTLTDWARADTAPKACALMSKRVRRGLLDSDSAACRSKKKLEAALGVVLKPAKIKVKNVSVTGDAAVADGEQQVPGTKGQSDTTRYHLVKEGSWKVDSVDPPHSQGTSTAPVT